MKRLTRAALLLLLVAAVCGRAEILKNQYISLLVDDFAQRISSFMTVEGSTRLFSDNDHPLLHQKTPSRTYLTVAIDGKYFK